MRSSSILFLEMIWVIRLWIHIYCVIVYFLLIPEYVIVVCYIFVCFHAYYDGEYYYLFATIGDVDKRVICCVCIYNKTLMIVYVRGYLFLVPELKKLGQ